MTEFSVCASRCTGKERDSESGNDYFGARYYASWTGRFLSPDPSGLYFANPYNPQSLNLYSYARNNPLKNTDPTGLDCVYLNDDGTGVQSVDHNSNFGECVGTDANGNPNGSNGGYWVNGNVNASGVTTNAATGQVSYGNAAVYSFQNGVLNTNEFGNSVTVNANVGQRDLSLSTDATDLRVPMDQIGPTPPRYPDLVGPRPVPPPIHNSVFNCLVLPDGTMDIQNAFRGQFNNNGDDSSGGSGGAAIWQNTAKGVRPFGNA
jgi:RHS repeat-associated protein